MQTTTNKIFENLEYYHNLAQKEKIFLYPTDSIYWIWAIPTTYTIQKIYEIKKREHNKPISIIAPNIWWITQNFFTSKNFQNQVQNYFEKYHTITILLQKKDSQFLKWIWQNNKVWVRIINHPIQKFIESLRQPFISTSANLSNQPHITNPQQIEENIIKEIDVVVNDWTINWKPSTIIDFTDWEKIIRN